MCPDVAVALTDAAAATADLVGPKAATLARLRQAGLPVPEAVCLTAEAYRRQIAKAGLGDTARGAGAEDGRRLALAMRLGLTNVDLDPAVADTLAAAGRRLAGRRGASLAVRSSALCEDEVGASFAGQFETFLGVAEHLDLVTATRACWASLWSTRALRYMRVHGIDPALSAMPVLLQRMVRAEAAGGVLSTTAGDQLVITGAWGLGSGIAQGDLVPDRFVLRRDASVASVDPGHKAHRVTAEAGGTRSSAVSQDRVETPCLSRREASALGRLVLAAEARLGAPVEIEWAKDRFRFWLLQARPLRVEAPPTVADLWSTHPALSGQPGGLGWGTGPACVVLHERDLDRVGTGAVVITRVAGPALAVALPRAAAVVAELGGSTSHLAALARERGIPAVLGAHGATRRIPDGAMVAVDGITGVVRWHRAT